MIFFGFWGMYSGFEFCEGWLDVKKKEYVDSEKYEICVWDWDRFGNIIWEILILNWIWCDNLVLYFYFNVLFFDVWNDKIFFYEKLILGCENVLFVVISFDLYNVQEVDVELLFWKFGLLDDGLLVVEDFVCYYCFIWLGKYQCICCDLGEFFFLIWCIVFKD